MPDKSHFICKHCIYYDVGFCKIYPVPTRKSAPSTEFCGQGKWMIWNELFKEMCPYYWGEWERDRPKTFEEDSSELIDAAKNATGVTYAMVGEPTGRPTASGVMFRALTPQEIYDAEEYLKKEGN